MQIRSLFLGALTPALLLSAASAQPTLVSLGTGLPLGISAPQAGTYHIGGTGGTGTVNVNRWSLNGSSLTIADAGTPGYGYISADGQHLAVSLINFPRFASGNSASDVTPAFTPLPTLLISDTQPSAEEFGGGRWNVVSNTFSNIGAMPIIPYTPNPLIPGQNEIGNSGIYGSSSAGFGEFLTTHGISGSGRFIVGQAYVCVYNQGETAGTNISTETYYWRPFLWDAQANAGAGGITVLPTPWRTADWPGANTRRRTGAAYAVSNDGLVVVGAQEHNTGVAPGVDADGARLVVWRWNALANKYNMTYLPNGVDADGFPYGQPQTPGSVVMNASGTIIIGRAQQSITERSYIAKWVWNPGTNSWNNPINLAFADELVAPASWLPESVTSCGLPPNVGGTLAMSDDGSTVVGSVVYSTCGSFMSGGFIWTQASGVATDWYDYCVAQGVPGVTSNFGPIGDGADPTRGLPKLGYPSTISPDGLMIAGFQGGNARIPGATPWVLRVASGAPAVPPSIVGNPVASFPFSKCTTPILNVAAAGSPPLSYQWFKNGAPITDGPSGNGGRYDGATGSQLRINGAAPADAGSYTCVVTGAGGATAVSTACAVQLDSAIGTAPNDLCSGAITIGEGTVTFNACSAMVEDTSVGTPSCFVGTPNANIADVYYRYVPTFTGYARIDACGSYYDAILTAYDGCQGNEIACNDDENTGPYGFCYTGSRIARLHVTAGVPVFIRVGAIGTELFGSATGSLTITANAPAEAPGNNCSNPVVATLGDNPFDTTEADSSGDTVTCNTSILTRDVWFDYTATATGTLRIATCGTPWNTVVSVHSACFTPDIDCNDDATDADCGGTTTDPISQSVLKAVPVTAGTHYLIRIAGAYSWDFGQGTLSLTFAPPAIACSPADIAYGDGEPLPPIGQPGGFNPVGPDGGDFDCFFNFYFAPAPDNAVCDIAYGDGEPLPPYGQPGGFNPGVDGGDFDCFFNYYFNGCL